MGMQTSIPHPLFDVLDKIRSLENKAGRPEGSVKLIAVSKTYPVSVVQQVVNLGQTALGENKVQEMMSKAEEIPQAQWHLIGHLQTNKVKYIAPFVAMIHSVDSEKLLAVIQKEAQKNNRILPILLQIFISGESTKTGMTPDEAKEILMKAHEYPNILFKGLMGMAANTDNLNLIRTQFSNLRKIKEELQNSTYTNVDFTELSMGMSSDYAIAIEEGATMVRIGSAIFGARQYA